MAAFLPIQPITFTSSPILPARKRFCERHSALRKPCSAKRRQSTMIEQNTIMIVTTMLAGIGGGIGLVAWTENQGKQTGERKNTQSCTECRGETTITCNVCNGSKTSPMDAEKVCSYCDGRGRITCFNCSGSGIQPRFLDRCVLFFSSSIAFMYQTDSNKFPTRFLRVQ